MTDETVHEKAQRGYRPQFVVGAADECWPWLGALDRKGYGKIRVGGHRGVWVLAHRLVYRLLVGPLLPTDQIDHTCRNHPCVNPAHLEVVTNRENQLRRPDVIAARTRSVCSRGHKMSPENTYTRPHGRVECRTCKRASVQRSRRRG